MLPRAATMLALQHYRELLFDIVFHKKPKKNFQTDKASLFLVQVRLCDVELVLALLFQNSFMQRSNGLGNRKAPTEFGLSDSDFYRVPRTYEHTGTRKIHIIRKKILVWVMPPSTTHTHRHTQSSVLFGDPSSPLILHS